MKRHIVLFALLLLPLSFFGCGDANLNAPPTNNAHPASWLSTHPASALATADFADCTICHAADLRGSDAAVSCFSCHAYNTDTNFTIHPTTWLTPYTSHRGTRDATICAKCHGGDLHGSPAAPSCFSSSINGVGTCHAAGPGLATHPIDSSFLAGASHGPVAIVDLVICQGCHGEAGGAGSNPRFNVGILSGDGTGCEYCHGVNLAHPPMWENSSMRSHSLAGNMANACALCHGVNLDGIGGVGVSCLSCHITNPLN